MKPAPPRPELGVFAGIVLQLLQRDPGLAWPSSQVAAATGLTERAAFTGLQRLLQLGLIRTRNADGWVRVVLTPQGRRARL